MSSFGYEEFEALAKEMITETGRIVSFVKLSSGAADPEKPWLGPGQPTIEQITRCPATFVPAGSGGWGTNVVTEEMLKRTNMICITASAFALPSRVDRIDDSGTSYGIEWRQTLRPAENAIVELFGVKR